MGLAPCTSILPFLEDYTRTASVLTNHKAGHPTTTSSVYRRGRRQSRHRHESPAAAGVLPGGQTTGRGGVRLHRRGRRAGTRVQARRRYAIDEERRLNHRSELIPLTGPESAYGYPPPTAMDAPPTPSAEGTAGCIVPDERLAVPSSNENS